jgi:hypothetical protein
MQELIAEISDDEDPRRKKWPVDSMTIINASLDLDAEIETYPFDIHKINVRKSRAHALFADKRSISAERMDVQMEPFLFRTPKIPGADGLQSATGTIALKSLNISGFNEFDINMKLRWRKQQDLMDFVRSTQWSKGEKAASSRLLRRCAALQPAGSDETSEPGILPEQILRERFHVR